MSHRNLAKIAATISIIAAIALTSASCGNGAGNIPDGGAAHETPNATPAQAGPVGINADGVEAPDAVLAAAVPEQTPGLNVNI